MSWAHKITAASFALVLLSSCSTVEKTTSNTPAPDWSKNGRLVFFGPKDAYSEMDEHSIPPLGTNANGLTAKNDPAEIWLADHDLSNKLYTRCGGVAPASSLDTGGNQTPALLVALVGWAITEVSTWFVDTIDKKLQDEIASYTVTRSATTDSADLYGIMGPFVPAKPGQILPKPLACFRATLRGPLNPKDPKSDPTIVADFIGSISYDAAKPEVLTLTPVRLYISRVLPQSEDYKVAIDVKLSADVTTRGELSGVVQKGAIDNSLIAESIDDIRKIDADHPLYKIYDDAAKTKHVNVPLPAWDYGGSDRERHNLTSATVTFTTVGHVDWFTKNLAALLHANKDDVAKDIAAEIKTPVDAALGAPAK